MSISDRLDQIRDRYVEWHEDRGDHTPAPDTEAWADADHPDESMEHCIVRCDVPAMLAALRAVLDLHEPIHALDYGARVRGGRFTHVCTGCGQDDGNWQYWPCPTVRAITTALGEA